MLKENNHSRRRWVGAIAAGVVASVGLLAVGASPSSAATSLSSTVAEAYGLDKVSSTIVIDASTAVINRLPAIEATSAQAEARNATPPTLTCTAGSTTVTSKGEYVSLDGTLAMFFSFDNEISATTDSCKVTKSSFINEKADTTYPFTAAARTALWGDGAKTLAAAEARLSGVTAKVRKAFNGAWTGDYVKRLATAMKEYSWTAVNFRFNADSTSAKQMYILRPESHGAFWLNICQRLADGRLVCMKYHPVSNKKTFSVDSVNKNIYTQYLTEGVTAS